MVSFRSRLARNQKGQGFVEYGAVLAFVSVLIASAVFRLNQPLATALSTSLGNASLQLSNLAALAGFGTGSGSSGGGSEGNSSGNGNGNNGGNGNGNGGGKK